MVPSAVVCGVVLKNWFYVSFFQFPGDFCWPGIGFLHKFYGVGFPNYVNSIEFAFASADGKASEIWLLAMSPTPQPALSCGVVCF